MERRGNDWSGTAGGARTGAERIGTDGSGEAGMDGHGRMRHGLDRPGWGRLGVAGKIELLWGINPKQFSNKWQ
jgi:hypothetical protein